jgi:fucose permease
LSSPTPQELSVARNASAQRRLVWAAQIAFIPTGILTTLLGPMLPILIARWALNDAQAGNLFVAQFLASLAGVQLSGILLARFGFRPAFLLGLLLMAAGIATIYVGSLWLGITAVSLYGLGTGLMNPTDNLLIAEISSGSGAGAISLLNFFWGLGAITCALSIAWAYAHNILPFLLGSVALLLVVLALAVRNLPFPGAIKAVKGEDSSASWRAIWRMPATWWFAAVFFLYPGAETAVGGWISSYVIRLGSHPQMGPLMPAFFWSGLTLGRFVGGGLLHRLPERRVLIGGFALGTAGIALLLWASSLAQVVASALITGLSFSTLYPITIARLSRHFGTATRSLGSVMFSMASIGPAVLPWMVGVVSNAAVNLRTGLLVPLAATAVLLLTHLREW